MIPKPGKEKFTFVFHRDNTAPKYFEIERKRLIAYLVAIPSGFIILFIAILVFTFFTREASRIAQQLPTSSLSINKDSSSSGDTEKLVKEKEVLEKEYQELKKANEALVEKLSSVSGKTAMPLQDLSFFTLIPDQKDNSATPIMSVNEIKITEENDELHFHANLLNTSSENSKISGHLFVIMKAENSFWFYPNEVLSKEKTSIHFNNGETVLFARLRPVDANFPKPAQGSKAFFKLLLFSRTGDLLHKEVFPYEVK